MRFTTLVLLVAVATAATSFKFAAVTDEDTKCYVYFKASDDANNAASNQGAWITDAAAAAAVADATGGILITSVGTTADSRTCALVASDATIVADTSLSPAAGTAITGATAVNSAFTEDSSWECLFTVTATAVTTSGEVLNDILTTGAAYYIGTDGSAGGAWTDNTDETQGVIATADQQTCTTTDDDINSFASSTAGYLTAGAILSASAMSFF